MMQSQVNALVHVVRGILTDVRVAYPAIEGLDLDFERLALYCQTRGISVFTLDLPALDGLLTAGLETGRLRLSGPFTRRVSKRVRVPRLFSGLWLRVFDRDACLKQDADETIIFFLRQLFRIGKNIAMECSPDRREAALERYHEIEQRLPRPTLKWEEDLLGDYAQIARNSLSDCCSLSGSTLELPLGISGVADQSLVRSRHVLERVQQVADLLLDDFAAFDPVLYSERKESLAEGIGFRHGPGAVAEQLKNHEKSRFDYWPDKLEERFPFEFCGKTAGQVRERPSFHEGPSRLHCVPKTAKGPRIIAAEPTSHMWCQMLMLDYLVGEYRRLFKGFFIDLRDQSKSAALVTQASLSRELATVDLSDASDRLSCWTVERVFRRHPSLLTALHAARTRYLRDDVSKIKGFLKLRKFASQGTAVTFPVQSFVFLCFALGVSIEGRVTKRKIWRLRNQVRVYGDDIIIPTHGYVDLVNTMELVGLKVNKTKSFVHGHFRESCGTDAYKGYDVTPVSPKTLDPNSPASRQAVLDTTNNLFNKGLWHASEQLRSLIPARLQRGIRVVAIRDAGYAGFTAFSGSDESHLRKRWNSRLHRYDVRVWRLLSQTRKKHADGDILLLAHFASKHNHEHARIVSEYGCSRKTRDGFLWEPLNTGARTSALPQGRGDIGSLASFAPQLHTGPGISCPGR